LRNESGKYTMHCEKIETEDLKCDDEGVKTLTQRHVTALEKVIRKYPAQWVWQHKRWKRMPKEESNVN
jgi:lauroyl/myristoyl acyltransferase